MKERLPIAVCRCLCWEIVCVVAVARRAHGAQDGGDAYTSAYGPMEGRMGFQPTDDMTPIQ